MKSGHCWPATVQPPERLTAQHDVRAFRNGVHAGLDDWLRERALKSEGLSARTYVVCEATGFRRVVGYYAVSAAAEQRLASPSAKLRQGTPEIVPLLLIGRLAVDDSCHGLGIGTALLSDALRRCVAASEIVGARGIVAHAIDNDAVRFYKLNGFLPSPLRERTMIMPVELACAIFQRP